MRIGRKGRAGSIARYQLKVGDVFMWKTKDGWRTFIVTKVRRHDLSAKRLTP